MIGRMVLDIEVGFVAVVVLWLLSAMALTALVALKVVLALLWRRIRAPRKPEPAAGPREAWLEDFG